MAEPRKGLLGRFFGGGEAAETTLRQPSPVSDETSQAAETSEAIFDEPEKRGWWGRLKSGLSRSSQSLTSGIADVFTKRKLDAEALEELEELLLHADLGMDTAGACGRGAVAPAAEQGSHRRRRSAQCLRRKSKRSLTPVAKPLDDRCCEEHPS